MPKRRTSKSLAAHREALEYFPGGVNSPVRAFGRVGGNPPFLARGKGAVVWDLDGNSYLDFVGSWGPLILGHAHPKVIRAIESAARKGTTFGAPTTAETALAREIRRRMPSLERMRFVSSGTEAAMSALRLARGTTGRPKILKFEGCYHGHADSLLVKAGSGALTFGAPDSAGVLEDVARQTLVAQYNDLESAAGLFARHGREIACVLVEPIAGNMGVVAPLPEFLPGLRALCDRNGALLIFDEVITGFRVHPGGAQALYGVRPDLTCLGKIVGGGLPLGVYGGRADLLAQISPEGPVYQAGTLSGNPLAVAAGLAVLKELTPAAYKKLERLSRKFGEALRGEIEDSGAEATLVRVGSLLTLYFSRGPIRGFADVMRSDAGRFKRFFQGALSRGVYLAPSPYEACFVSLAHGEAQIEKAAKAMGEALREVR